VLVLVFLRGRARCDGISQNLMGLANAAVACISNISWKAYFYLSVHPVQFSLWLADRIKRIASVHAEWQTSVANGSMLNVPLVLHIIP
jgi:hypothetical protein